ncbi:toxin glutamine deamidase domain-containing protein (plasmid) [Streptomyces sp. HUAS TT11]|uniref:toxin glutamine deamidase domain-containing protein n=1 Tax=Streptomyces sp. HUAS TT11 TaxID=3447508 RepID=UPI003F65CD1C
MPAHYDDAHIRDLGNEWINTGLKLHEYLGTMHSSVQSMNDGWTGKAGRAAQVVWNGVAEHNIWHAIWEAGWVAQEIGKAVINYADELQKTIKEINRAHLIEALSTIFGMVLGIASFGIAGLLGRLATLVGELVEGIAASISRIAAAAGTIGRAAAFAADTAINAATTLGTDVLSEFMASSAAHGPTKINWAGEGINVGLGVLMGWGMGGIDVLQAPHNLGGNGVPRVSAPSPTPTPTPTPTNIAVPHPSGVPHTGLPSVRDLTPFPSNSVFQTNHAPPTGSGMTNPVTGAPRPNAGGPGVETSGTTRPTTPVPHADPPSTSVGHITTGGGGQPPGRLRSETIPTNGTPQAFLDGPPRSTRDVSGGATTPPAAHENGTGGKGGTGSGLDVRNEIPPSTAASHGGGARENALPSTGGPTQTRGGGARDTATSHAGGGRGTSAAAHGSASEGGPSSGTPARGTGTPERPEAQPAVTGGHGTGAPEGTGTRPGAQPVTTGGRGGTDVPTSGVRSGSPESSGGTRATHDGPQHSRPAGGGGGRRAVDSQDGKAASEGTIVHAETSANTETTAGAERSVDSLASSASETPTGRQHDFGSGATAHDDAHGGGRVVEPDPGHDAHAVLVREDAGKTAKWNTFKQEQNARNLPVVEAEARLEFHRQDLDTAWQNAYDKYAENDLFGGSHLSQDGREAQTAEWQWRNDITREFRAEVDRTGHISSDAFTRIVDRARHNAYKYLVRADQNERFTARFKEQVDAYKANRFGEGGDLPQFDRAPSKYVYDRDLQTYVKDDTKAYGYPDDGGQGPVAKLKDGADGSRPDDFTFIEHTSDGDAPVDHFRDKSHDFNVLEQYYIGKHEEFSRALDGFLHDGDTSGGLPAHTARQLDGLLDNVFQDLGAIATREHDIQVATKEMFDDVIRWNSTGAEALPDDFVNQVRLDFQRDLRTDHDLVFRHGDGDRPRALWDLTTTRAIDELPGRIAKEHFIRGRLAEETLHAQGRLSELGEDFLAHFGEDGRQRVVGEYLDTVRTTAARHFIERWGDGPKARESAPQWTDVRDNLRSTLPDRIRHEGDLQAVVGESAHTFHEILGHPGSTESFQLHEDTVSRLGNDFRTERVVKYDALFAPEGHKTQAWLSHESRHEDGFRSRLSDLRDGDYYSDLNSLHYPVFRDWRAGGASPSESVSVRPGTPEHPAAPEGHSAASEGHTPAPESHTPAPMDDSDTPVPPREHTGGRQEVTVVPTVQTHQGQGPSEVRTQANHAPRHQDGSQVQVTRERDTAGSPGTMPQTPAVTVHTSASATAHRPTEQGQGRQQASRQEDSLALDLPGEVQGWPRNTSEYTFTRTQVDHVHQELLQARPLLDFLARNTQWLPGRAMVLPASQTLGVPEISGFVTRLADELDAPVVFPVAQEDASAPPSWAAFDPAEGVFHTADDLDGVLGALPETARFGETEALPYDVLPAADHARLEEATRRALAERGIDDVSAGRIARVHEDLLDAGLLSRQAPIAVRAEVTAELLAEGLRLTAAVDDALGARTERHVSYEDVDEAVRQLTAERGEAFLSLPVAVQAEAIADHIVGMDLDEPEALPLSTVDKGKAAVRGPVAASVEQDDEHLDFGRSLRSPMEQREGESTRPSSGDWRAVSDAGVALTEARSVWNDTVDDFVAAEERHLEGVGFSAKAEGRGLAQAWDRFVRAEAELTRAEERWSEATGGAPLPEVQEVEARNGVLPGGSRVSRWLRGHREVPAVAGPEGVVQSVTLVPAASHVVIDGRRAGEVTGHDVHVLIPTSRDLMVAYWLQHPEGVDDSFKAEMDALNAARATAARVELITALDSRITSLADDLELFRDLRSRRVWDRLETSQIAALVMAERRGLRAMAADRDELISKLRSGAWPWAKGYLLGGGIDGVLDSLVDSVLGTLRNDMSLTVNVRLDAGATSEGTVLDAMVRDNTVLLRNAWESTPGQTGYLFGSRGPAEEALGYASTVKRTGQASGIYGARTGAPDEFFAPSDQDRSALPVYAALTSPHRPQALKSYGSAVFHLKHAVMERATFTPEDSFRPGPRGAQGVTGLGNLLPLLNHGDESLVRLAFAEATDFAFDPGYRALRDSGSLSSRLQGYIEAQIHGGVTWQDLDRVVLFHDSHDRVKAQEALSQKDVLETFARDNGFSLTVETVPVFPGVRPAAVPYGASGAKVHESYEDLHFTAGLLDEHGVASARGLGAGGAGGAGVSALVRPFEELRSAYGWLEEVNPYRAQGGGFGTNCVLTAIAVDLSLRDGGVHQASASDVGAVRQGAEDASGLRNYLENYLDRVPDPVAGAEAVAAAMSAAPVGARGMVVIESAGGEIDHVVNVTRDHNGVVFLDGQSGFPVREPAGVVSFLPTTQGIPGFPLHSDADLVTDGAPQRLLGSGQGATVPELNETSGPRKRGTRMTVIDGVGRAVDSGILGVQPQSGSTAQALVDAPVGHGYGMLGRAAGGRGIGGLLWNQGAADREAELSRKYGIRIGPPADRPNDHFSHSTLSRIDGVLASLPREHVIGNPALTAIQPAVPEAGENSSGYDISQRLIDIVSPYGLPSWLLTELNRASGWQRALMDKAALSEYREISEDGDRELGIGDGQRQVMGGVSNVLAQGNYVKWMLRHEIGHSVDQRINWMAGLLQQSRFGGWRIYTDNDLGELATRVLGKAGLGDHLHVNSRYRQSLLNAATAALHPGVALNHPLVTGLFADFPGQSAGIALVVRFKQLAQAQPWTLLDGGGDVLDIGGRMYQVSRDGQWVSYLRAERTNHSVSNYQFSSPSEWFAEAYAAFYGTRPEPRARLNPEVRAYFGRELPEYFRSNREDSSAASFAPSSTSGRIAASTSAPAPAPAWASTSTSTSVPAQGWAPTAASASTWAPAPMLSPAEALFREVNQRLQRMGARLATRDQVAEADRKLSARRGAGYTLSDLRARSVDVVERLLGRPQGGLGGAGRTDGAAVTGESSAAGTSGSVTDTSRAAGPIRSTAVRSGLVDRTVLEGMSPVERRNGLADFQLRWLIWEKSANRQGEAGLPEGHPLFTALVEAANYVGGHTLVGIEDRLAEHAGDLFQLDRADQDLVIVASRLLTHLGDGPVAERLARSIPVGVGSEDLRGLLSPASTADDSTAVPARSDTLYPMREAPSAVISTVPSSGGTPEFTAPVAPVTADIGVRSRTGGGSVVDAEEKLRVSVDAAVVRAVAQAGVGMDAFVADPAVLNCVVLLDALLDELFPVVGELGGSRAAFRAVRPAFARDDLVSRSGRTEERLVPGGRWLPLSSMDQLVDALVTAGVGSKAVVLEQGLEGIGHALLYANVGLKADMGEVLIARVDPQASSRVEVLDRRDLQRWVRAGHGTRMTVIDGVGRAVDSGILGVQPQSGSTAQALVDAPVGHGYGMLGRAAGGRGIGGLLWNQGAADREAELSRKYGIRIGPPADRPNDHFSHSTLSRIDGVLASLPREHVIGNPALTAIQPAVPEAGENSSGYDISQRLIDIVSPYGLPSWLLTELNRASGWQRALMDKAALSEYREISEDGDRELGIGDGQRQVMGGVSNVLAQGNYVKWMLRHEIGHSVDQRINWMAGLLQQSRFGGWRIYTDNDLGELATRVLGKAGLGDHLHVNSRYRQSLLNAATAALHPGVALNHPLVTRLFADFPGQSAGIALVVRFKQLAQAQPWTLLDGGGDVLDIGGRMYQVSRDGQWVSYLRAERTNHSVSNYQFSSPSEWFAEAYAAFYGTHPEPRARLNPEVRAYFGRELPEYFRSNREDSSAASFAPNSTSGPIAASTSAPGFVPRGLGAGGAGVSALVRPFEELRSAYGWLEEVNPYRAQGGGFGTNCVLTAIAVDLSLRDGGVHQASASDVGAVRQGAEDASGLRNYLENYLDRVPDPVAGAGAVAAAMSAAPVGARGMVVIESAGGEIDHVVNVTRDHNGVVFLDGQSGFPVREPAGVVSFLPTTQGIPGFPLHSDADLVTDGAPQRLLGSGQGATVPELNETSGPLKELVEEPAPRRLRPVTGAVDLDERRPPRVDLELPPAPLSTGPVRFSDGTQLPIYMTGGVGSQLPGLPQDVVRRSFAFGQGDRTLRGIDLVVRELDEQLGRSVGTRPAPVKGSRAQDGFGLLDRVSRSLRDNPQGFFGEGRTFLYKAADGKTRTLGVTARLYGNWERFASGHGNPVKVDTMQRSTGTSGQVKVNATSLGLASTVPLGPVNQFVSPWGRLHFRFNFGKQVRYNQQRQVVNQTETRTLDGSHVHVDDVWFEFEVKDRHGTAIDLSGKPIQQGEDTARRPVEFGFAVRGGVMVRIADSLTTGKALTGELPQRLTLGSDSRLRMVNTEAFGPTGHIRDWVVEQIGVTSDSMAASQIGEFFSTGGFHGMSRALNSGRVVTPPLFGGESGSEPLGVFSVKVESGDAVLINETTAAELRDIVQSTARNERQIGRSHGAEVGVSVGPMFQLFGLENGEFDLRLLAGLNGRYGASRSRSTLSGGSAAVKIAAQVKGSATGLYLVQKKITVTAPPTGHRGKLWKDTPRSRITPRSETFQTWAVERLTRTEASRLAGLDKGKPAGREPEAPPYLTQQEPSTLGMSRVEEFTFADGSISRDVDGKKVTFPERFADEVLQKVGEAYPDLVAPLRELNPRSPRWRNADHFGIVLHNTLEVLNQLSHHSMASNVETMMTTGLRIDLVESARMSRGHRYVWVDAKLTERRYEGKQEDLRLRFSAPGTEVVGGQQSGSRAAQIGLEAAVSPRDTNTDEISRPEQLGTVFVGVRVGKRTESESGYGMAATHEALSIGTGGSHLYSYKISLSAKRGGYWRPRRWMRGLLFMNALGTQPFVFGEPEGRLIGPPEQSGTQDASGLGRVLLSVPVEHTPVAPVTTADRTVKAPEALSAEEARNLAMDMGTVPAATVDRASTVLLSQHPHETVSVIADKELSGALKDVLNEASGGSWTVMQKGAPAHDAALQLVESKNLRANFDQSSAETGWRAPELFASAPYLNRSTWLAHRTTLLSGMTALTSAQRIETETTVGGVANSTGRYTRTSTLFFGGQLGYQKSHGLGTGVTGNYTLVVSPYRRDTLTSKTVQRSAVSEINRKDTGRRVLASAAVLHEIAAASERIGAWAHGNSHLPTSLVGASGRRLVVPGGWVGHLPEKSAYRLGVLKDDFGDVPLYNKRSWSPLPLLRGQAFGSWPVNSLDTAAAVRRFEAALKPLGLSTQDLEQLRRLVSGRVVRAIGREMSGSGSAVPARIGRWGSEWAQTWVGRRQARLRVQLVPVKSAADGFGGLGHSVELEEHRQAVESVQQTRGRASGKLIGFVVSEGAHTPDAVARSAGPTHSQMGSSVQGTVQTQNDGTVKYSTVTTTQAHGEYTTEYELRLELEITDTTPADPAAAGHAGADRLKDQAGRWLQMWTGRRKHSISVQENVGRLIEHFPLSLMRPEPQDSAGQSDPLAPPPLEGPGEPHRVALPPSLGAGGWHDVAHRGAGGKVEVKPFEMPQEGFAVRGVIGLDGLRAANTLALGAAYDVSLSVPGHGPISADLLAQAKNTPLTRAGTGSAQSLEDGTSNGALAAFYEQTLTPRGYQVAGLTDRGFFGGADGSLAIYSKPDLSKVRLMAVADGMKFEGANREVHGASSSAGRAGWAGHVLQGGPTTSSPAVGTNQIGSGFGAHEVDSVTAGLAGEWLTSVNVKPEKGRAFLFAIPTKWLSIAQVHHHVKDSTPVEAVRSVFGNPQREPQAMEADATVLAWVREDVARRLGLVGEASFPAKVAESWDAVGKADKEWTAADKAYWDLRRGDAAKRESELAAADKALNAFTGSVPSVEDALKELNALELDDDFAEPAHDGWEQVRSEQIEQARTTVGMARQVAAARDARDAAQQRLDEVKADLAARLAYADALADEYARVRGLTDRLTNWYQLQASTQGRGLIKNVEEPPKAAFWPPSKANAAKTAASQKGKEADRTGLGGSAGVFRPLDAGSGAVVLRPEEELRLAYGWLDEVNPSRAQGDGFETNCVLTAIAVDLTLRDGAVHQAPPSEVGGDRQVAEDASGLRNYLENYLDRLPDPVSGSQAVVAAMSAAPVGARGMVVVENAAGGIDHVVNVTHDHNGVVFLDGQSGMPIYAPAGVVSFLPTTEGIPGHVLHHATTAGTTAPPRTLGAPVGQTSHAERVEEDRPGFAEGVSSGVTHAAASRADSQDDVSLDDLYGPAVQPKTVKRGEKDDTVPPRVRVNPLWYPVKDFKKALLERGGVWSYVIDEHGRFFLGSEDVWSIAGEEERKELFDAMRAAHPDLTMEDLKGWLNDQGVPTVAAGFDETGAAVVGSARVGGELFRDPLTGQWTIDASSRYVGPVVRPGVEPATVTRWVRNAAEALSSALGMPIRAKDAEQPTVAHGALVAGTGTGELDHDYGPLAGPKKVKDRERDPAAVDRVRVNPLWYRLENFTPSLLKRIGGVWHYAVDEDGQISIGSDQILSIMTEKELDELLAHMLRAGHNLTREQLKAAIDNQGHPTVAVGFREDGTTAVRPARVSGELSYNPASQVWELTDKSGRYMSNKIRPSVDPGEAQRWLANTARRISEHLGVPVEPVLFKNAPVAATEAGIRHDLAAAAVRTVVAPEVVDVAEQAEAVDLLRLERFRAYTTDPAGSDLRSLSRVVALDRMLSDYQAIDEHDYARRAASLDQLVDRARTYAATTKNEFRRQAVQRLVEQAGTRAVEYRQQAGPREEPAGAVESTPTGPLGYRERIALAKREWRGPVIEEVARLETMLLDAGPGARSLVMGAAPGEQLWAVNVLGTVRWVEQGTAQVTQAPQSAQGTVVSIDLDSRARLIKPDPRLLGADTEAARFCGLVVGGDLKHVV